jgi:hypothetical protein
MPCVSTVNSISDDTKLSNFTRRSSTLSLSSISTYSIGIGISCCCPYISVHSHKDDSCFVTDRVFFHIIIIIIIISLLMSPLLGHRRSLWITHKENALREPSAGWWVLTSTNAIETNGLTCLPKFGGARDNKFLVTHPMTFFWVGNAFTHSPIAVSVSV